LFPAGNEDIIEASAAEESRILQYVTASNRFPAFGTL